MVGVSDEDASLWFPTETRDMMRNVTGVDLRLIDYGHKFVFVAQVGSPQKAVYELRDFITPPQGIGMEALITGRSVSAGAVPVHSHTLKL